MTPEIMWAILVAMGAIAIGAVLKAVESASELKLTNQKLSRCLAELDALKHQHNQTISNMQELNSAEKNKLAERIAELEKNAEHQRLKPIQYPGPKGGGSWMA